MFANIKRRLHPARPSVIRGRVRQGWQHRIDRFVTEWPRTHMALVTALGAIGLVYLLAFPLFALKLLSGLPGRWAAAASAIDWVMVAAAAALAALLGLVSWQIARLSFRLPGNEVLENSEAPGLFDSVEELRVHYRSPPIHRIALTDRHDIEVIRTPRYGFPFLFTNTLMVGMPVLLTLTPGQFRVLLARRIGQFSIRDGGPGSWLYTLLRLWPQYLEGTPVPRTPVNWLLWVFFPWYVPLLRRLSRRAAVQVELDADVCALQVINDEAVAEALVAAMVRERFLAETFWPELEPAWPGTPQPRSFPYGRMTQTVQGLSPAEARRWLDKALSDEGRDGDRPGLGTRLENVGHSTVPSPGPLDGTAAEFCLDASLAAQVKRMDSAWFRKIMPVWNERYALRQRALQRLKALAAKARGGRLGSEEARDYAALAERLLPPSQASAVHRQLVSMGIADADLNLRIGRYLLARGDEKGVTALERAAADDKGCAMSAARLLAQYFTRRGQPEAASRYLKQALAARAS
jgi:hypothetical protein